MFKLTGCLNAVKANKMSARMFYPLTDLTCLAGQKNSLCAENIKHWY